MSKRKKVSMAISGGVDSSAAVFLLQKQGYEIIGMFMRLINNGDDEQAARRVCAKLGIKFYPINYSGQFKKEVIDYFVESYKKGLTPNPCVRCNKLIKFGALLNSAMGIGADYLATGHYVRITNYELRITKRSKTSHCHSCAGRNPGSARLTINSRFCVDENKIAFCDSKKLQIANNKYKLYRGKDKSKDQSYFLYNLTQGQMANVLFPLGDYTKEEVKKIADKHELPYLKKESQDVCFLKGDHNDFLREHINLKSGPIVALKSIPRPPAPSPKEEKGSNNLPSYLGGAGGGINREVGGGINRRAGEVIGEHQGLPLYTIGQRKGVEIGGIGPFYVAKCDYKTNTLYVVSDRDDPVLYSDELIAGDVNWISGKEPKLPLECQAVIRYRHKPTECIVIVGTGQCPVQQDKLTMGCNRATMGCNSATMGCNPLLIKFNNQQRAVTPGQSVVLYNGDEVLGGGIIQ